MIGQSKKELAVLEVNLLASSLMNQAELLYHVLFTTMSTLLKTFSVKNDYFLLEYNHKKFCVTFQIIISYLIFTGHAWTHRRTIVLKFF
jgi:hypothetical protein